MEWKTSVEPVDYAFAVQAMEARVEAIRERGAQELGWLLEHPPLYTAGTSAKADDLLENAAFPVFESGRGGQYTYHGPGQRVVYIMRDLKRYEEKPDLRRYVKQLEAWLIATLSEWGLHGQTREGRIGIWVETPKGECKIAALGIRVRRWVTYHGVALNVSPDLSHFSGIVPCGIRDYGVTSLQALGIEPTMDDVDQALKRQFERVFTLK